MKLQLIYDSEDIRSGYKVIDSIGDHKCDLRLTKGDVSWIEAHVFDGECEEILIVECLSYFNSYLTQQILDGWIKKLAIGGIMTITDVDCLSVAKAMYDRQLSVTEGNNLLHGAQTQPWLLRKTGVSLEQLVEYFEMRGLKVLSKKLVGYNFVVSAQRV